MALKATIYKATVNVADLDRNQFLDARSEEHTSELQSRINLVCRLLLEKKNNQTDDTSGTAVPD